MKKILVEPPKEEYVLATDLRLSDLHFIGAEDKGGSRGLVIERATKSSHSRNEARYALVFNGTIVYQVDLAWQPLMNLLENNIKEGTRFFEFESLEDLLRWIAD